MEFITENTFFLLVHPHSPHLDFVRMLFLRTCCLVIFCGEIKCMLKFLGGALLKKASSFAEICVLWKDMAEFSARKTERLWENIFVPSFASYFCWQSRGPINPLEKSL